MDKNHQLLHNHLCKLSNPAHMMADRAQALSDIIAAGGRVDFGSPQDRPHVNVALGDFQGAVIGREGADVWMVFTDAIRYAISDITRVNEWVITLRRRYGHMAVTNTGVHDRRSGYCIEVRPEWFSGHFSILPKGREVWAWTANGMDKYTDEPLMMDTLYDIIEYIESFRKEQ